MSYNKVKENQKRSKPSKEKKHSFLLKIILRIVTILVVSFVLVLSAYFLWTKISEVKVMKNRAMVDRQLSLCQELVVENLDIQILSQ